MPVVVRKLEGDASVDSSQPNFRYGAFEAQTQNYETFQYGPNLISAHLAHKYSTGKGVRIALIDTGVDDKNNDLKKTVIEKKTLRVTKVTGKTFTEQSWQESLLPFLITDLALTEWRPMPKSSPSKS